jgi:3-dehydroquinate dehydratase/shikimate dehydrogenase
MGLRCRIFNGLEGVTVTGVFGNGVGRLCGVVAAPTARQLRRLVKQALQDTPTVEIRLDWLRSDAERHTFLSWLEKQRFLKAQLIATCRRRVGGGEFTGDAGAELFWLMRAREADCAWCDLEMETLHELPGKTVRGYAVPEKVLLSMHDFRRTPTFPEKLSLPQNGGANAIKAAAMARSLSDAARMLRLTRSSRDVVAVAMGEIGLPARVLSLREGSALAYAPVDSATAPGQIRLADMKHLYRAHELTRATRVYGVIGNPIGHSLSPLMHNTGYIAAKRDAVFLPFLVENLKDFLKCLADFGVRGFSVTLPYKEKIFAHLDGVEPLAEKIGAVNTVSVGKDGSLYGRNTDYIGVLRALAKNAQLRGNRAVIYGAGGAARAAAFALNHAGAQVFICSRRPEVARKLAKAVAGEAIPRSALRTQEFDTLVNATPLGMHPHEKVSPLAAAELNCSLVMDLVYRPMRTKLLKLAASRGIATVSGVEMFLAQGFAQWERWMGGKAPESRMRSAVLRALKNEENTRW